jgi:hypothetical protein
VLQNTLIRRVPKQVEVLSRLRSLTLAHNHVLDSVAAEVAQLAALEGRGHGAECDGVLFGVCLCLSVRIVCLSVSASVSVSVCFSVACLCILFLSVSVSVSFSISLSVSLSVSHIFFRLPLWVFLFH